MMPVIRMPDGAQVRFPDDMPDDQIRGMIASKFPELAGGGSSAKGDAPSDWVGQSGPVSASMGAGTPGSDMAPLLSGFQNELLAAAQRTSPVLSTIKGEEIRPVVSREVAFNDQGQPMIRVNGESRMLDPENEIILLDGGVPVAFQRTENTNAGFLDSLARIVLPGVAGGQLPRAAARAAPKAVSAVTAAADRQNINVTLPTATDSRVVKGIAAANREIPIASGIQETGINREIGQVAQRADEVAGGTARTRDEAGRALREGLDNYQASAGREFNLRNVDDAGLSQMIRSPSRASSFSRKASALYERAGRRVPPDARGDASSTLEALAQIRNRFQNPQLREQFENSFIGRFAKSLEGAQTWGDLRQARSEVRGLRARELSEAERTIGDAQIRNIERALTDDILRLTGAAGGDDAVKALRRADGFYGAGQNRLDNARKLLKVGSDEQLYQRVVQLAENGGRADIAKLNQIKKTVGDDAWADVGAVAIRRMGQPTAGAADAAIETAAGPFSVGSFVTSYSKLTPKGRAILFNKPQREALDDLATVASSQKQTARYSVPTGGGVGVGRAGTAGIVGIGILDAWTTAAASILGASGAAWLMSNPKVVRSIAAMARARRPEQVARQAEQLRLTLNSDPSIAPVADQFVARLLGETTSQAETENR